MEGLMIKNFGAVKMEMDNIRGLAPFRERQVATAFKHQPVNSCY